MNLFKKAIITAACAGGMLAAGQAQAANWLMLQGTEKPGAAARAKLWGFIQVQYQNDSSDANATGGYIPPKLIGPNLSSQSAFNVNRARIGVRGTGMPLDSKVNYFVLLEFGNNAITETDNSFTKATDASITLNHIPGARIRTGLFKTPGAEEGLQAIHVFDYINFTSVSNQMLLERFPNRAYTPNVPAQPIPVTQDLQGFDKSVSAFRDVGIQVFDSFIVGGNNDWDLSYAVMIGNGNGLNFSDNNSDKEYYGYVSAEKMYGGKGPFAEGMKFLAWTQTGKRNYDGNNDGVSEKYNRDRWGVGFKYKRAAWRATGEYMAGEGMILQGVNNPSYGLGPAAGKPAAPAGNGLNGKADGWYVEGGWRIGKSNWELDLRYDIYNRLKDDKLEINFDTWTLGAQYFFNKKTRLTMNYSFRDYNAGNFGEGKGPNANLDGVSDRAAVQVTHIF